MARSRRIITVARRPGSGAEPAPSAPSTRRRKYRSLSATTSYREPRGTVGCRQLEGDLRTIPQSIGTLFNITKLLNFSVFYILFPLKTSGKLHLHFNFQIFHPAGDVRLLVHRTPLGYFSDCDRQRHEGGHEAAGPRLHHTQLHV